MFSEIVKIIYKTTPIQLKKLKGAKHISKNVKLSNKIEQQARNLDFKNHKENFNSKLPCSLINS